jgi:ferritin-like metal-binding protein YciE
LLGENEASALLEKTLEEEKETDHKLSELAEDINVQAKETGSEGEEREEAMPRGKARGARA